VFRQVSATGWDEDLLIGALMRTCPIEKLAILADDAPHMFFTQDQDVVQTLASNTADEPFAYRVRFGSIERRVDEFNASTFDRVFKTLPILIVIIADQKARAVPEGYGFPHLLRASSFLTIG